MIKTFLTIIKIRNTETATRSCGEARLGQPRSGIMLDPTPASATVYTSTSTLISGMMDELECPVAVLGQNASVLM
jgi:hypothetical protein